jgi:hypothetical protein
MVASTVFMTLAETSTCCRLPCISTKGWATSVGFCELKVSALAIFAAFLSMPVSPFWIPCSALPSAEVICMISPYEAVKIRRLLELAAASGTGLAWTRAAPLSPWAECRKPSRFLQAVQTA